MSVERNETIVAIAERVTYCLAEDGFAFVEDDQVEALAETLASFLEAAGIPTQP